MPTPRDVINRAVARSLKNDIDGLAVNETELLEVARRAVLGIFSLAAEIDPVWAGASLTVANQLQGSAPFWPRPDDAEAVFRIMVNRDTDEDGTLDTQLECQRIPINDLGLDTTKPALYILGENYWSAGGVLDPVDTETLTFFYSQVPSVPASLDTDIDDRIPDRFMPLVELEVAAHLAVKDGRAEELPGLQSEGKAWVGLFTTYVRHRDAGQSSRFKSHRTPSQQVAQVPPLIGAGG